MVAAVVVLSGADFVDVSGAIAIVICRIDNQGRPWIDPNLPVLVLVISLVSLLE